MFGAGEANQHPSLASEGRLFNAHPTVRRAWSAGRRKKDGGGGLDVQHDVQGIAASGGW